MKEYIEREAIIKKICNSCDGWCDRVDCNCVNCKSEHRCEFMKDVANQPTADVVEVVRCKDCKKRYVPTRCALYFATVDDKEYFVERGDDFYCSYGERKDGVDNGK